MELNGSERDEILICVIIGIIYDLLILKHSKYSRKPPKMLNSCTECNIYWVKVDTKVT